MAEKNDLRKGKSAEMEALEKRVMELEEAVDPFKLAPRVLDIAIKGRGDKTAYVDATYTLACDVVLDLEWQGRRYRVPAFEL